MRETAKVVTYVELKKEVVDKPFFSDWSGESPVWSEMVMLPESIAPLFDFPCNHGKAGDHNDVRFMGDGFTLYSEKIDGYTGKLVIADGRAYLQYRSSGVRSFYANGAKFASVPVIRLQVEVIECEDGGMKVVVCEVISGGMGCPNTFIGRMKYWEAFENLSPNVSMLLYTKRWYLSWKDVYRDYCSQGWEGIVVMDSMVQSPFVGKRYSKTARYYKRFPTVDVQGPDGIEERTLEGDFVRHRPDKDYPNTVGDHSRVVTGVTPQELDVIMCSSWSKDSERVIRSFLRWWSCGGDKVFPNVPDARVIGAISTLRSSFMLRIDFSEDASELNKIRRDFFAAVKRDPHRWKVLPRFGESYAPSDEPLKEDVDWS